MFHYPDTREMHYNGGVKIDMYLSFDDDFGLLYLSREELLILSREVDFLLFLSCDEELSLNLSGDAVFCLYFSSSSDADLDLLLYCSEEFCLYPLGDGDL